jgi:hypothetical protein
MELLEKIINWIYPEAPRPDFCPNCKSQDLAIEETVYQFNFPGHHALPSNSILPGPVKYTCRDCNAHGEYIKPAKKE